MWGFHVYSVCMKFRGEPLPPELVVVLFCSLMTKMTPPPSPLHPKMQSRVGKKKGKLRSGAESRL